MGRIKQTVRKSTGGRFPRPPRQPYQKPPPELNQVNLDTFLSVKEITAFGQIHEMYQQNDFDREDTEIFAKMMFLCTEGRLRDLEELIDNYDQDSIDDDKIKYNSAQHMILQNAQDLNTGKRIIDIAALNGHLHIMEYL